MTEQLTDNATSPPVDLVWLIMLRWAAIAGQVLTILGVEAGLSIGLPMLPLFSIIAVEVISNVLAQVRLSRGDVSESLPVAILAVDVLALTGLLYFSGGPHNPFNFLYLVYIALAAVVLRPTATWALAALSVVSFGALFVDSVALDALGGHGGMDHGGMDHGSMDHGSMDHGGSPAVDPMALHLRGMWVAFTVGAAFIVYFVTRVKSALASRDVALAAARDAAIQSERLASLATLAGGAAHELATPLGIIAIVAKELELELAHLEVQGTAIADVQLIRAQVDRCRTVLDQLAVDAGESPGESQRTLALSELIDGSLESMGRRDRVQLQVPAELLQMRMVGYPSALQQAVRAVLRNGLDASAPDGEVTLTAAAHPVGLRIVVRDRGHGMAPVTLARAADPFFTTKEHGEGMGLGLFLGRTVVERMGGSLELDSAPGEGTTVTITLPTEAANV